MALTHQAKLSYLESHFTVWLIFDLSKLSELTVWATENFVHVPGGFGQF